jgi:hypothetical protein
VVFWKSVGDLLTVSWPKVVIEVIQSVSLVASTGSAYAAVNHKLDWLPPACAGIACSAVWKVVHFLAERKAKAQDVALQEEFDYSGPRKLDHSVSY